MADQYEEFEKLIQAGELGTAELRLFDWIQYHPNDARAWLLYGKCVSNPAQKRDCFKRAIDLDPSNTEAHELLKQLNTIVSPVYQDKEQSGVNVPSFPISSPLPTKFSSSSAISKPPMLSEQAKTRLSVILYSLFHFLFTILLGVILIFIFSASVPGLLSINKPDDTIQRNWLSNTSPSETTQGLQNLATVFLNPSRLDYREVNSYQELRSLRTSITIDSSASGSIEFNGVSFVGQLVGGNVLQNGKEGQPLVVVMDVVFDETRIPVVYYGPADNLDYEDTILVEGVYIEEANGIAAQRVERLSTNASTQVDNDTLFMLRVAGVIMLWALFCFSVFFWRLNLKRWWQEHTALLSPVGAMLLLLLIALSITGCTIDLSTTLRTDGTGITTIMVHESKENMDFLRSAPGISGYLSAVIRDVRKSGAMFEQYIEGDQEVFLLQRFLNNSSEGTGNTYPIVGSWVYVQRYYEENEEVLRFMGMVDTRTLYQNPNEVGSDVASVLRDQLNQIDMEYHLNVPGRLVYHNGNEATSQQVSWQIRMNDINYLVAETRFPAAENKVASTLNTRYIWIALGGVFALSTIFLIASLWIRPSPNKVGRKA